MSLSDTMSSITSSPIASSSSSSSSSPSSSSSSYANSDSSQLTIPTTLLILPPTAAILGFIIGVRRGGSRARLRFLAENAHRAPKTVQGWYFYTKTRNYKMAHGAINYGLKYAAVLSGAAVLYGTLDEGFGWARENIAGIIRYGPQIDPPLSERERAGRWGERTSWKGGESVWWDGSFAGGVLALGVGLRYRLPRQLFVRALVLGVTMGGASTALQIGLARAKVHELERWRAQKAIEQEQERKDEAKRLADTAAVTPLKQQVSQPQPLVVKRIAGAEEPKKSGWWDTFRSWLPGQS
ncbi:hypothetical protein BCR39DRAFT_522937 [Naematelia encephala]|uniref:Uncharacterized protein n=1 Tax=Naematelia encephala TaxID=71784 RepID=A0A1Y2BCT5_9TREE|nr:hypothetical protein BCR39DRAFT_522937 [Naematelia encephala]